jgi:hypothetical protein
MYSYLRSRKSRAFTLTVVIGYHRDEEIGREWEDGDQYTWPIQTFKCTEDGNGNVSVEHDITLPLHPCWILKPGRKHYIEGPSENALGITFPSNLPELLAAEKESNGTV